MLERVDSTNRYALDEARRGAPEGLVIVADEQSAGRGRLGREWLAPPSSSLLCSVLFRPVIGLENLHVVSSALALAALDALDRCAPVGASLKWPNDLVAGGRKLAGILAEVELGEAGQDGHVPIPALVVGIGLNLTWPAGFGSSSQERALLKTAITLAELGREPGRDVLLEAFLSALEVRYEQISSAEGRTETMGHYRSACSTIGARVHVVAPDGEWGGRARTVDDRGRLVVEREGAVVSLEVGDVIHVRTEAARR